MYKFEYQVVVTSGHPSTEQLSSYGKMGWELVTICGIGYSMVHTTFKRRITTVRQAYLDQEEFNVAKTLVSLASAQDDEQFGPKFGTIRAVEIGK